jgi:NADPH:quinone reductase-like Zn-dependent oxidoreductase
MHAAVLHTIGSVPRYEEFPEPVISNKDGGDKDGEVLVHVHAASLKPVDKQMASGSHYASRGELPASAARTESGTCKTGSGSSLVVLDHPMAPWHSVQLCRAHSRFQSRKM